MSFQILSGDVFDMLPTIAPGSIDCVCTSPPYWMLRSYLPKDHPFKSLELGSEKTPAEYVRNMVRVFGLVRSAMADHAALWLNIGDTYSSNGGADPKNSNKGNNHHGRSMRPGNPEKNGGASNRSVAVAPGFDAGNLCLIPQRLAIALQDDGWIVRSIIVWHKPAPMPASVRGWEWRRCRVKTTPKDSPRYHNRKTAIDNGVYPQTYDPTAEWSDCPGCKKCEPNGGFVLRRGSWRPTSSWEPILMLAKSTRYYCDGEAVKQPPASATVSRDNYTRVIDDPDEQFAVRHDHETICDGANLRDVWTIAAEPLKEKHYAAFPSELVRRCLQAGTSAKGYCPTCGKPWVRVLEGTPETEAVRSAPRNGQDWTARAWDNSDKRSGKSGDKKTNWSPSDKTIGWRPSCRCPVADPRPGKVLDCFCGSGRTGITARKLGLDFVGVELNPGYVDMATRLITDDNPLFNVESAP